MKDCPEKFVNFTQATDSGDIELRICFEEAESRIKELDDTKKLAQLQTEIKAGNCSEIIYPSHNRELMVITRLWSENRCRIPKLDPHRLKIVQN